MTGQWRRRWNIVLLLFTGGGACSTPRLAQEPDSGRERFHLFLLVGQSNMAGRGVIEPQDLVAHPRVLTLDRHEQWVPAVDPIHFDKPIAAVGPGRTFGLAVAEGDPTVRVGLIPAAVGGSAITAWEPGARDPVTGAFPYDDALRRARAAMRDGEVKAILWHQGESDANPLAAPQYERRLGGLIERFRRDLGNPDLPVFVGQLGRFGGKPWGLPHLQVDSAHRRVASRLPNVVFVSTEGLEHKGDTLHFSAAAERTLGRRYAGAYQRWRTMGGRK